MHVDHGEDLKRLALLLGVGFGIGEHGPEEGYQINVVAADPCGLQ